MSDASLGGAAFLIAAYALGGCGGSKPQPVDLGGDLGMLGDLFHEEPDLSAVAPPDFGTDMSVFVPPDLENPDLPCSFALSSRTLHEIWCDPANHAVFCLSENPPAAGF